MIKNRNNLYLEKEIEEKRNKLHQLLEYGDRENILKFSQELDLLINEYNDNTIKTERNSY